MNNFLSADISEKMSEFLAKITPPYNTVRIAKLGVVSECEENFFDPITYNIINFPVLLHNKSFDFDTLDMIMFNANGLAKNPFNNIPFKMSDITPDYDLHAAIQKKLRSAEDDATSKPLPPPLPTTEIDRIIKKSIELLLNQKLLNLNDLTISEFRDLAGMANQFNPEALFLYSLYFKENLYVEQSNPIFIKYLRYAIEQGLGLAQSFYATYCEYGLYGVEQNHTEAVRYYKLAADQKIVLALYNYGRCLSFGIGTNKNLVEAAMYFKAAANQGYALAQYNYGVCCKRGYGVDINLSEAERYYAMAEEQELPQAKARSKRKQYKY